MRDDPTCSVVRVGDGRGFVVRHGIDRLIITAAHCLPFFPPCASFGGTEERTYQSLAAPIGADPTIWTECHFVDPVGDVAVLGPPDSEELYEQRDAYEALFDSMEAIRIADFPPRQRVPVRMLALRGEWFDAVVEHLDGPLWIVEAAEKIEGGMSGSPIIDKDGAAIGVVCCSSTVDGRFTQSGPNPRLFYNLPGWLLHNPAVSRRPTKSRGIIRTWDAGE